MDTVKQEKLTELPNYDRTDWFSSVSLKSLNVNMPVVYVSSRVDNKPHNVPVYTKYLYVGNETRVSSKK